jgi:broad specificity phosphatase PhoE
VVVETRPDRVESVGAAHQLHRRAAHPAWGGHGSAAGPIAGEQKILVGVDQPEATRSPHRELAGFGDQAEITDDLVEWNYGEFEGRTTQEIRAEAPGWTIWNGILPGGEAPDDVGRRCQRVIDRAKEAGGDVALFSHGHILRVMAATWLGLQPIEGRCFTLGTGTYSVLGYEHEYTTTLVWNQSVQAVVEAIE